MARSDITISTSQTEEVIYTDTEAADYLGLVVYSKTHATASFYVVVEDTHLPAPDPKAMMIRKWGAEWAAPARTPFTGVA